MMALLPLLSTVKTNNNEKMVVIRTKKAWSLSFFNRNWMEMIAFNLHLGPPKVHLKS